MSFIAAKKIYLAVCRCQKIGKQPGNKAIWRGSFGCLSKIKWFGARLLRSNSVEGIKSEAEEIGIQRDTPRGGPVIGRGREERHDSCPARGRRVLGRRGRPWVQQVDGRRGGRTLAGGVKSGERAADVGGGHQLRHVQPRERERRRRDVVESAAPVPTTAPCRHSSVMSAIVSAFECTVDGG